MSAIEAAREAFLNLIADAIEWKEEPDGDIDSSGRMINCTTYHLITGYRELDELVEALGIDRRYDETAYQAIDRAISDEDQDEQEGGR